MTMTDQHISSAYDRDLEAIQALVMKMGGLVEAAILQGAQALMSRDTELADQVRKGDKAVDELEELVNEEVARTIALRAPVSKDLRVILSVLRFAGSLERMGDYAKNIAKRVGVLAELRPITGTDAALRRMAHEVQQMLKDTLDAFVSRDVERAPRGNQPRSGRGPDVQCAVPAVPDLHAGRSPQHHGLHASAFHRQEHGAPGRSGHQHGRAGDLHDNRKAPGRRTAEVRRNRLHRRPALGPGHACPHVLVVEDEPAQREVLVYNLTAEGYRTSAAATGEEALVMVREEQPDLMLLDWMLPQVSGSRSAAS